MAKTKSLEDIKGKDVARMEGHNACRPVRTPSCYGGGGEDQLAVYHTSAGCQVGDNWGGPIGCILYVHWMPSWRQVRKQINVDQIQKTNARKLSERKGSSRTVQSGLRTGELATRTMAQVGELKDTRQQGSQDKVVCNA